VVNQFREGSLLWSFIPILFVHLSLSNGEVAANPGTSIPQLEDHFEFIYEVQVPRIVNDGRLWIPLARNDEFQSVLSRDIETSLDYSILKDQRFGNQILYFEPDSSHAGELIRIRYHVRRKQKQGYSSSELDPKLFLRPDRLVPQDEQFKEIAGKLVEPGVGETGQGRALYQHVLQRMRYDKSGIGWGRGDALFACDSRAGNCTDFHSYFIALARSIGIPARFAIGFTIPETVNQGSIEGYHCWAEFHAEGKWIPVDISEAWKTPSLQDYYFGHQPGNRIEFTIGRDLITEPLPESGPFNYLVYPLFEENGQTLPLLQSFRYSRILR
jgi:transglutaminase-like putative cysteine protease